MSRLASFLTALWLSTVTAQLTNELQAAVDPVGKTIAVVGSTVCTPLREIGIKFYEDTGEEPDLSKLTIVYMNRTQTYTYNLTDAATVIPNESWFNPSLPFRVYVHGFTDDPSKESFQTVRDAYLTRGEVILALDVSSQIRFFYIRSTIIIKYVGEKLGQLIVALVRAGLKLANVHLIGHSLGAHIVGFAGKTVRNQTGSPIGRTTGLDTAGPCIAKTDVTLRLAKGDAEFVDVIHTDAGVYGIDLQMGDADYYPNGGSEQPKCLQQTCSHSRAWRYYAESVVNTTAFIGVKCYSWEGFRKKQCNYNDTSLMGFASTPLSSGRYYMQTSGEKPFGRGVAGLTYVDEAGLVRNVQYAIGDIFSG